MVSPFGRGFDSLQLHMQKKDHLKAAFLSYVEHVSFFYFASRKRSLRSLGGPPGPRSPKGYLFCGAGGSRTLVQRGNRGPYFSSPQRTVALWAISLGVSLAPIRLYPTFSRLAALRDRVARRATYFVELKGVGVLILVRHSERWPCGPSRSGSRSPQYVRTRGFLLFDF